MADDPYRYLTAAQRAMTPQQRWLLYNGGAYDPADKPFGLGEGGQDYLFEAWKADFDVLLAMGQATVAELFAGNEPRTVSRLSASSFAEAGNVTGDYPAGRAVVLAQTASGVGYVVSAIFNSGANRTEVTVEGVTVDAGLTQCALGLDPRYAPKSQNAKALAIIFG
jgi:hypothetical protein